MDEGDAQRAPRGGAARPSMELGPVTRPAVPPRAGCRRARPPACPDGRLVLRAPALGAGRARPRSRRARDGRRRRRPRRPLPRPVARTGHGRAAHRVRAPEPPAQRLPALLHDGHPRLGPDPGAAPPQGPGPPGADDLAVPASRRRPPGAGVRQRRVPRARGSTSASSTRTTWTSERGGGRRPPGLLRGVGCGAPGAGAVRDPAGPGPDASPPGGPRAPGAGNSRRAHRRDQRQGQRGGARRCLPRRGGVSRRRDSQAASRQLPRADPDRRAADRRGATSPASSAPAFRSPIGSPAATARRPSSSC